MSRALHQFRAEFLRRLATGEPVEPGSCGPSEKYDAKNRQSVGPLVGDLRRRGVIVRTSVAMPSMRAARKRSTSQCWRAADPAACRALAAADRQWLADHPADDCEGDVPRQRTLF